MLAVIAAPTLDYIGGEIRLGGPAYYIGTAAAYLEPTMLLVTTKSSVSSFLSRLGHFLEIVEAGVGETVFEIEILKDGRDLRLLRQSKFEVEALLRAVKHCESVVVSTTYKELDAQDLSTLAENRSIVVDVQGFVREARKSGKIFLDTRKVYELGRHLSASKRSILRGERTEFPRECWECPLRCSELLGADLIITDGERPFKIASYNGECLYEVEPLVGLHGEPVGLGDVFTAALSFYLLTKKWDLVGAAVAASVAAALKLRGRHPWFSTAELDILRSKVIVRQERCAEQRRIVA